MPPRFWLLLAMAACDATREPSHPASPTAPKPAPGAPLASAAASTNTPPNAPNTPNTPTNTPSPPTAAAVVKRTLASNSFVVPGPVSRVAVTPDGELVAALSDRFTGTDLIAPLVVWDRSGAERYRTSDVTDAAFDSRGALLVVARGSRPIELVETHRWTVRRAIAPCGTKVRVEGVAVSPDDKTLAVACPNGPVRLQPIGGGAALAVGRTAGARHVAWSRDGAWLAVTDESSWIRIVEVKTRRTRHAIKTTAFHAMAFAPNANVLAFGDFQSTRRLDVATGREQPVLAIDAGSLAFSPDGMQLAVAPITGAVSVQVVELATGARRDLVGTARKTYAKLVFDSAGRLWVGQDHAVRAFDVAARAVTIGPAGHRGAVTQLAFRGDGRVLASASSDRTVRIWDLTASARPSRVLEVITTDDGGILPRTGDDAAYRKHPMAAGTGLAWAADGNLITTDEYVLREWRRDTYELLKAKRLQHELGGVAVLPDGRLLTLGLDGDHVTLRWSDRDAGKLRHLDYDVTRIYPRLRLAMSGDGKRVAVSGAVVRVLDAATGDVIAEAGDSDARGLSLDRTGAVLGVAGTYVMHVKRIGKGPDPALPHTSLRVTAIAIAPDGKRAVAGGSAGEVAVIDLERGETIEEVVHHGAVRAIAIAPDGRSFATGGDDGALVIAPLH